MNFIRKYIRAIISEALKETSLIEDYPSTFNMEHFKTLKSFRERIAYCENFLQRISSGSSRIVYKIDDEKVLKLAKNEKGIAQNETEIHWGNDYYFGSILANTIESHPNALWVEMELARKITKSEFLRLTGFRIEDFNAYLRNFEEENKGKKPLFSMEPELDARMDEDNFVQEIREFMISAESPAGDLGRLNSYGVVKREGHDTVVLIDYGLTKDVYSTHYDKSKKMNFYEMEEKDEKYLFAFNVNIVGSDGDDIQLYVVGNTAEEFMRNLDAQLAAGKNPPIEDDARANLYNKLADLEDEHKPRKHITELNNSNYDLKDMPNGKYDGSIKGHEVYMDSMDSGFRATSGYKNISPIPCTVYIDNGSAIVYSKGGVLFSDAEIEEKWRNKYGKGMAALEKDERMKEYLK